MINKINRKFAKQTFEVFGSWSADEFSSFTLRKSSILAQVSALYTRYTVVLLKQLTGARGDILLKTNQVELLSLFAHVAVHADGVRWRVELKELRLRLSLRSFLGEVETDVLHRFRFVLSLDSMRSLCAQILAQQQHQLQRSTRVCSRKDRRHVLMFFEKNFQTLTTCWIFCQTSRML